jgi:hypothetical protein
MTARLIPSNKNEIEYVITVGSPPNRNVLMVINIELLPLLHSCTISAAMLRITPVNAVQRQMQH